MEYKAVVYDDRIVVAHLVSGEEGKGKYKLYDYEGLLVHDADNSIPNTEEPDPELGISENSEEALWKTNEELFEDNFLEEVEINDPSELQSLSDLGTVRPDLDIVEKEVNGETRYLVHVTINSLENINNNHEDDEEIETDEEEFAQPDEDTVGEDGHGEGIGGTGDQKLVD